MALKILIVDDSKLVHAMIAQTLDMSGVEIEEVFHAMNGKEGLEKLQNQTLDLVFSDIHMPIMDGVEMIERMRHDEAIQHIPVVVISSEGSHKRLDELKSFGVQHFIRKPFTPEMINTVIHEVMGEANA